jgi:predicted porin
LYEFPEAGWSFGFSASNLGNQLKAYYTTKEDLPIDMRLGFSKQFEKVPLRVFFSFNRLYETADDFLNRFKNYTFGGEIKLSKALRVRLGYNNQIRKDLKIGTTSGLAGLNLGVGITVANYLIDYSFSSMGPVGSISRFGISTSL